MEACQKHKIQSTRLNQLKSLTDSLQPESLLYSKPPTVFFLQLEQACSLVLIFMTMFFCTARAGAVWKLVKNIRFNLQD
jgi:hypothetical protein